MSPLVNTVFILIKLPWNRATTAAFQLSEGFVRFLSWGTSFTGGGGQYSLVNNVRGDIIHGGTFFTPTPGPKASVRQIHPLDLHFSHVCFVARVDTAAPRALLYCTKSEIDNTLHGC